MRGGELCNHSSASKKEFRIQHIKGLFGGKEETIVSTVVRLVLPLQNHIGSTTHREYSSNCQLKVAKYCDGSMVELLAIGSIAKVNFIALLQNDVPRGGNGLGGNQAKEVSDLTNRSVMMIRY